ncbi:DUF3761 domain-containing protein [Arthrobacter sp. MMS18-M83]|uniref:DUF3761 domain-containing protein n=1 Tax=Arthrobacter sp. MMS18-M83 TaxID=2996261 RepID=UPI00227CAFA7|nr:DUF3761 domain-containing protein [Arthrobacter sp. MMS18-M83]WAH97778.1 DUF3761 domain-containing protein [Arthrobacter sp. MMS18-M83]
MTNHTPPGKRRFRLPVSTIVVGILLLFFLVPAAFGSGIGGVLIMAGIFSFLTGLYVVVTGRRSWAMVPGDRKAGAIVLTGALVLLISGGALTPAKPNDGLQASPTSADSQKLAGTAASPSSSPTPTPTVTETGTPLDPDSVTELSRSASYTAPKSQPGYSTKAVDLLATLPVKGRAPMTGYDRDQFGQAWADVDRNGCDTRNDILNRDPNKSFRCDYVARQISVKATYNLWVTQAEHDAMARVLGDCPNETAPTNQKPPATPEPTPSAPAQDAAPAPEAPVQAPVPAPVPAAPAPVVPAAPVPAPPAAPAPAPAPAPVPVPGGGATALCNDGTLSFSANHSGTCSHHGGVAIWYK